MLFRVGLRCNQIPNLGHPPRVAPSTQCRIFLVVVETFRRVADSLRRKLGQNGCVLERTTKSIRRWSCYWDGKQSVNWDKFHETEALEAAGSYQQAIDALKDLTDSAVDSVDGYLINAGIANNLRKLRRFDEARGYIRKSYDVLAPDSPYFASAMFIEAQIDEETGHLNEALIKLDNIVRRYPRVLADPTHGYLEEYILCIRGIVLAGLRRYEEARPILEGAVAEGCCRERTLYYLGLCCYRLGLLGSAERHLTEALTTDLNPHYAQLTHYYLAMAYLWQGKSAWARQEFEWCLEHVDVGDVPLVHILEGLVKTSRSLGQEEDAERYSKMLNRVQ